MTKTSRLMDNKDIKNINWEERRFIASTIILSGICSNYANPISCRYDAEDAVNLADSLISVLTGIPTNEVEAELYNTPQKEEPNVSL